jgi:signal recognition particle subunit SRP54
MFENLSERLSGVFDRLTKQGALSEDVVRTAMREVRVALLEADVSLPVARDSSRRCRKKATGAGGHEIGHAGPAGHQDRP